MSFSFNATTREVLEQVVREPRFQQLTKLRVFAPMEIGLAAGAFFLFFAGSWLYIAGDVGFLLMLFINSIAIYASFTPLHDATHRSVSCNRKVNDLVGTICCLLLLPGITTRIYRYLHLEHHRYAGSQSKDPDEPFVSAAPWKLPFILAGLDVHWTIWYLRHWQTRPLSERFEFVACLTFYIGLHASFLLSPYAFEFILCFMIPQRFGLFYVSWFFAHIQHPEGVEWEQAPFQTTVKLKTNRLTGWLLLGQARHCLHHLAPSIPYYRYKQAWDLGEHLFSSQGVPTRTLWRKSEDLKLPEINEPRWLTATVARVETVGKNIKTYDLIPANVGPWPSFSAGAHIDVKMTEKMVRQYSLCNLPSDNQRYQIAVKSLADGQGGSLFMHAEISEGSVIQISPPRNNFTLNTAFKHYVLIAAGIGVTPLLAMAHELHLKNRPFELHLFARCKEDIAFHDTLMDFPFAASIRLHIKDQVGTARSLINESINQYEAGSGLYLCGPSGFMAEVIKRAKDKSWPGENLFSETFVPTLINNKENNVFEVKIASTGEVLSVPADQQLIDVLHNHGYAVMCSCTQGICGSCTTGVLEGVPEHRDAIMSDEERATNKKMTVCVSRAHSQQLILDL